MDNTRTLVEEGLRKEAFNRITRRTFTKIALTGALAKTAIASPPQQQIHPPLQELSSRSEDLIAGSNRSW